ncbi:MAG TPA: hypothetical protein VGL99_33590 [Chloroflexota bacterium]
MGAVHPRTFDPVALCEVPAILLTPSGVVGMADEQLVDVHHKDHPATRNAQVNGVSVGFTAHYAAMRERFGAHLRDGIAGENVIVGTERKVDLTTIAGGLVIRTAGGELVPLEQVQVAEPCVEFTRFALCLGHADPSTGDVTEGLRFLREGIRGFYASYAGSGVVVRAGDMVFVRD